MCAPSVASEEEGVMREAKEKAEEGALPFR